MKELSIEEKAERYNKALINDSRLWECGEITRENYEYIFSELKENEDEKIREWIINDIRYNMDNEPLNNSEYKKNAEKAIAWLEKQCKETSWKPSKEEMDVLYGLAYITNQYDEHKEEVITRLYQDLKREFFNGSSYENMFPNTEYGVRRRSTIEVLEYARTLDTYNQYGKEDIDKNIAWLEAQGDKDKLIKELGEYKVKYTQEVLEKHINSMSNKDDERLRKTTIGFLKHFADKGYENAVECIDWLKEQGEQNLANSRKGAQISVLSEEDMIAISRAMSIVRWAAYRDHSHPIINDKGATELIDQLKSIKERYTWKPSDEQMEGLHWVLEFCNTSYHTNVLKELVEQLKKLREG